MSTSSASCNFGCCRVSYYWFVCVAVKTGQTRYQDGRKHSGLNYNIIGLEQNCCGLT